MVARHRDPGSLLPARRKTCWRTTHREGTSQTAFASLGQHWPGRSSSRRRRSSAEAAVATARNNSVRCRRRRIIPSRNCKAPASMRAEPERIRNHMRMRSLPGRAASWLAPRINEHPPSANARRAGLLVACHHSHLAIRTAAQTPPQGTGANEDVMYQGS